MDGGLPSGVKRAVLAATDSLNCPFVQRSACSGIGDRLPPESPIGMRRNR